MPPVIHDASSNCRIRSRLIRSAGDFVVAFAHRSSYASVTCLLSELVRKGDWNPAGLAAPNAGGIASAPDPLGSYQASSIVRHGQRNGPVESRGAIGPDRTTDRRCHRDDNPNDQPCGACDCTQCEHH